MSFFIPRIGNQPLRMSTDSSARVLYSLKSRGPLGTHDLAPCLGITEVGTRQHLARLRDDGLVADENRSGEVGRPRRIWRLTAKGHARFKYCSLQPKILFRSKQTPRPPNQSSPSRPAVVLA